MKNLIKIDRIINFSVDLSGLRVTAQITSKTI